MYQATDLAALSGPAFYAELEAQLAALVAGEADALANAANCAALIFDQVPDLNWAGFYYVESGSGDLVVGPFQGKPACARIAPGKGVCGAAVERGESILVPDVHAFPGHIACDAASRSELVIPLRRGGRIFAVLDLDSPTPNRFTIEDQVGMERLMAVLQAAPGRVDNRFQPRHDAR
jgi:GAF domain-containing protein